MSRSALVFAAKATRPNPFELCRMVARATRVIHRDKQRIADTMNEVFIRLSGDQPESKIPAEIDPTKLSG